MDYRIPPGTEAVEKLEDFIAVNRLTANTRIPSERDLCEMWGISRSTLRQAVDILVGWGVLYSRIIEATKQISKKLQIPLGQKVYEYIRIRSVDYTPALLETTYIDCQRYPDFDKRYTENTPMGDLFKNIYHKKQSSGKEHISVTYASENEAHLLEVTPDSPLFFTSGVVKDEQDIPITYYKQLIRSDLFKFVSEIDKSRSEE